MGMRARPEAGRFAFLFPDLLVLVPIRGKRSAPRVPKLSKTIRAGLQCSALVQVLEDQRIAFALIALERVVGFLFVVFPDAAMLTAQTVEQTP